MEDEGKEHFRDDDPEQLKVKVLKTITAVFGVEVATSLGHRGTYLALDGTAVAFFRPVVEEADPVVVLRLQLLVEELVIQLRPAGLHEGEVPPGLLVPAKAE